MTTEKYIVWMNKTIRTWKEAVELNYNTDVLTFGMLRVEFNDLRNRILYRRRKLNPLPTKEQEIVISNLGKGLVKSYWHWRRILLEDEE